MPRKKLFLCLVSIFCSVVLASETLIFLLPLSCIITCLVLEKERKREKERYFSWLLTWTLMSGLGELRIWARAKHAKRRVFSYTYCTCAGILLLCLTSGYSNVGNFVTSTIVLLSTKKSIFRYFFESSINWNDEKQHFLNSLSNLRRNKKICHTFTKAHQCTNNTAPHFMHERCSAILACSLSARCFHFAPEASS